MSLLALIATFVVTAALLASVPAALRLVDYGARAIAALGRRPILASLTVFAITAALGVVPTIIWSVPVPAIHDEFAYLLAADTFVHGRLTNPTPPMWEHFETFHEIMTPTYASKFPIAQGVALAIGQIIAHPIVGVWLSTALGALAIYWMLRAYFAPRWALLGGMLAAIHATTQWYVTSYWGGGVGVIGGALVGGACARAVRLPSVKLGVVLGLGLAILANSRPFEGLILAGIVIPVMLFRGRQTAVVVRLLLPAGAVLVPTFTFMGYYNWRVTGDALTLPYALHARQYMSAPLFYWQPPPDPIVYRHDELREFFLSDELKTYRSSATFRGFLRHSGDQTRMLLLEYLHPLTLAIPLAAGVFAARNNRGARAALAVCVLLPGIHLLVTPWMRVQYMAPGAGFFFVLVVAGLRNLCATSLSRTRFGRIVACATLVTLIVSPLPRAITLNELGHRAPAVHRARLIEQLSARGGKFLVLVDEIPGRLGGFEWVFNGADLEDAGVIFARSMNPHADRALFERYSQRNLWGIVADEPTVRDGPLRRTATTEPDAPR
ncbi:MAG: hypothetical protein ACREJC_20225 [Tepidisphaeraceae bacterium]